MRRELVVAAAGGAVLTAVMATIVYVGSTQRPEGHAALFQPGSDGPSADIVAEDFPDAVIPDGSGHDGQQFYAIARAPMHLDEVSEQLSRPRYRLQRPLFAWLSWMLHPQGGGKGLAIAMFAVGIGSVALLTLSATAVATRLGSRPWPALVMPVLPGVFATLRIGVADNLALGLALGAVLFMLKGRAVPAACAAVLAVLAKESMLVVILGQAVASRRRADVAAALAAGGAVAGWNLALRALVDTSEPQVVEFTYPFGGVVDSLPYWLDGLFPVAAVHVFVVIAVVGWALARVPRRHPLYGALVATAAFSVLLGKDVIGLDYNGPRTLMPVLVLALLALSTREAEVERSPTTDRESIDVRG